MLTLCAYHWQRRCAAFVVILTLVFPAAVMLGQSTTATGSIQGTITDPSGAVVSAAPITIASQTTGQEFHLVSSAAGTYNSGAVLPGTYLVRIDAKGFRSVSFPIVVRVGVVSAGNVKLQLGAELRVLTVESSAVCDSGVSDQPIHARSHHRIDLVGRGQRGHRNWHASVSR